MNDSFQAYRNLTANTTSILGYLEFEEPGFFAALTVPEDKNGMTMVTKSRKPIRKDYLYERWINNKSLGVYSDLLPAHSHEVWKLDQKVREEKDMS